MGPLPTPEAPWPSVIPSLSEQALLELLLLFYKGQQEAGRVFMELQSCVPALDLCFRSSLGLAEAR